MAKWVALPASNLGPVNDFLSELFFVVVVVVVVAVVVVDAYGQLTRCIRFCLDD